MHPLRKHTHLLSNIIQKSPTNEKTKILTYDWSITSKKEWIKQILFLPKCLVVATRFPVGTSFDIEWLVSVAGGLCTVSTTGITTAGAPFSECATWIVLADRNREKPGDMHLEENILTRSFKPERCKIFAKRLFQYGRRFASLSPIMQCKSCKETADQWCDSSAIFEVWRKSLLDIGWENLLKNNFISVVLAEQNGSKQNLHTCARRYWELWTMELSHTREQTKLSYRQTVSRFSPS